MITEDAAAEMVGAILLTVILGSAIALVGYQWISQIETASPPYATLEIACGNSSAFPPDLKDFSCRVALLNCSAETFDQCTDECKKFWTEGTNQYEQCAALCGEENYCIDSTKYENCNMLFICHGGGDSLLLDEFSIRINGAVRDPVTPGDLFNFDQVSNNLFESGEVIRYSLLETDIPLESVTLIYHDRQSGQNMVLARKEFCCEPTHY